MSGKEVADLARQNDICTFCGNNRQKDCHLGKDLSCQIENCPHKHNMLFCYRRSGILTQNQVKNSNSRTNVNDKKNSIIRN